MLQRLSTSFKDTCSVFVRTVFERRNNSTCPSTPPLAVPGVHPGVDQAVGPMPGAHSRVAHCEEFLQEDVST